MMIRARMLQFISRYEKRKQKNETSCNNDCTMQANPYIYAICLCLLFTFLCNSGNRRTSILFIDHRNQQKYSRLNKYYSSLAKGLRFVPFPSNTWRIQYEFRFEPFKNAHQRIMKSHQFPLHHLLPVRLRILGIFQVPRFLRLYKTVLVNTFSLLVRCRTLTLSVGYRGYSHYVQ